MKMSVVGCEASGKTVFLSALADYYRGGDRPSLVPENAAANNFQRFQLRQMRGLRQWPPATDPGKTVELKWTLRRERKILSEIDMLEFGGETFREAFRGEAVSESHAAAAKTLTDHLSASDFTVVLVSLKDLLRDPGEMSPEEFERDTEALWVTRGLLEFLKSKVPHAKVVIGLTQADLHRGLFAAEGDAAKLFRERWPSIAAVADGIPVLPVASVSATDELGNPAPDYTTDGILPVMTEFAKAKPRRGNFRPFLLLLLLASSALLYFTYSPDARREGTAHNIREDAKVTRREGTAHNLREDAKVTRRAPTAALTEAITPVVITNIVNETITLTNLVEQTVVVTNFIETIAPTNLPNLQTSKLPNLQTSALRTWHDHRGTPIEARWMETSENRKTIILETADGKRIRAAVRKFSAEDQQFIQSVLNP